MHDGAHILAEIEDKLKKITALAELEWYALNAVSKDGPLAPLIQAIKTAPPEEKKQIGVLVNTLRTTIEQRIAQRRLELIKAADSEEKDVTLPVQAPMGSLHPVTYAIEEIADIFKSIGFTRLSYPEVEWEWYAFEALNLGKDHPARDDVETFFIQENADPNLGRMVLTPHTSSGQVREFKRLGTPPVRTINISKTYRPNWDATHTPMFHQFEGICVDKNITIANLKGTIDYFVKKFFGMERKIRLRPYKFMFTEPSFEIDITCGICMGEGQVNGEKCKMCKSGWLELGGSGMIHEQVLRNGGVDPDEYTGWAFGFGVERVYSMKQGFNLDDIRILYSNDIRFLEQF